MHIFFYYYHYLIAVMFRRLECNSIQNLYYLLILKWAYVIYVVTHREFDLPVQQQSLGTQYHRACGRPQYFRCWCCNKEAENSDGWILHTHTIKPAEQEMCKIGAVCENLCCHWEEFSSYEENLLNKSQLLIFDHKNLSIGWCIFLLFFFLGRH